MSETPMGSRGSEPRLELLLEVASQLLRAEDPATVVSSVATRVCEVVGCDVFMNYLLVSTSTGMRLRLNSCGGLTDAMRPEFEWYDLGSPICGVVAQTGKEWVWDETMTNAPGTIFDASSRIGHRTYACFPLHIGTRIVGTLGFGSRHHSRFTPEEIALLRSVADPIALAMQRVESDAALRAARDAAETARATAEAANSAKDRFLATLSHELRTPLTPIATVLTLLESHPDLPPDVHEDLALIRRNLLTETRLIDDLLDFNRVARGKIALHTELIDLPGLVRSTLDAFRPELDAKQLRTSTAFTPLPRPPLADPLRIRQILSNLVSNALKFTPEGGLISVAVAPAAGDTLRLVVTDTGMGIPADLLPSLFTPFEQGKRAHRPEGLGLGLVIARSLAQLHGGTLTASSPGDNLGATFTLTLPLRPTESPGALSSEVEEVSGAQAPRGNAATSPGQGRPRLLLVEDHPDSLRVMSRYLYKIGFDVVCAMTMREAQAAFTTQRADVLVSDIGLPDGTGHDLLRWLRRLDGKLPAVAVSGFGMEDDIRRSTEAGFATHLTKPVDLSVLRDALAQISPQAAN